MKLPARSAVLLFALTFPGWSRAANLARSVGAPSGAGPAVVPVIAAPGAGDTSLSLGSSLGALSIAPGSAGMNFGAPAVADGALQAAAALQPVPALAAETRASPAVAALASPAAAGREAAAAAPIGRAGVTFSAIGNGAAEESASPAPGASSTGALDKKKSEKLPATFGQFADGSRGAAGHIAVMTDLLEMEHREEAEQYSRQRRTGFRELEESGLSVAGLNLENVGPADGGFYVYELNRPGDESTPFHAFGRGDTIVLTAGSRELAGRVYEVEGRKLSIAIQTEEEIPQSRLRVTMGYSEATYIRAKEALTRLADGEGYEGVGGVLLGLRAPESDPIRGVQFRDRGLNDFQRDAVRMALAAKDVALIHGPPGTGKTRTLVEFILQSVKRGESVLATAPSNVAVDTILERLADSGRRLVRIGHPARTPEHLRRFNIEILMEKESEWRRIVQLREELKAAKDGEGRGRRQARRAERQTAMAEELAELEGRARTRILERADVVLATHGGVYGRLRKKGFDVAVMDEASQATEPVSWIPLLQASKAVFGGDLKQLAPTVISREAASRGLSRTIMERLVAWLPESMQSLLRVQYRMHPDIMDWVSREFYDGELIADPSTHGRDAASLDGVAKNDLTTVPVQFVDTAEMHFGEAHPPRGPSLLNRGEADAAMTIVDRLLAAGMRPEQIGVIGSYKAQERLLVAMRDLPALVRSTVHGFQGQEREVIVLSLVRSNEGGDLGFISDPHLLDVAVSRARRGVIVIGDSRTLGTNPMYARLIEHARERGVIRPVSEFGGKP